MTQGCNRTYRRYGLVCGRRPAGGLTGVPAVAVAATLLAFATPSAAQSNDASGAVPVQTEPGFTARLDAQLGVAGGLTADDVAAAASVTSYDVKARRAEVRQAEASVDRALVAFMPRTTLTARYTRLSSIPTSQAGTVVAAPGAPEGPIAPGTPLINAPLTFRTLQNQYLLQSNLSVPVSDYFLRFPGSVASARHGVRAAKFNEQAARRSARTNGRLAYYSWVIAKLESEVAAQALSQAQAHLADARVAEQAGSATPADVLAVEAQVASSRVLREHARSLTRSYEERIRTLMHGRAPTELRIGEDIRTAPAPLERRATVDSLCRKAVASRPELRAMNARVASLRDKADVERAGIFPRIDGFASMQYSNPNSRIFPQRDDFTRTWEVGGTLSWTLSDVPASLASVRAVEAEVAEVMADKKSLEDAIRIEISDALESVREADANVQPSLDQLASATEAYRVRRLLFLVGRATSVELTDAETELTRARIEALNSYVNQRVARVNVAHAIGA